jgi:DHA3 family macrolide efflux protein-like MFS transporter
MSLVLGLTNAGTRILRMTYLFKVIPNQVFGRAGSIFFISNILFRLTFLSIFTLPFFHLSNNIIYTFVVFTVFLIIAGTTLIWNDQRKI